MLLQGLLEAVVKYFSTQYTLNIELSRNGYEVQITDTYGPLT